MLRILSFVISCSLVSSADWNYVNPSSWGNDYSTCNMKRQSPIDLPPIVDMEYDSNLESFSFHGFHRPGSSYNLTMRNNGHTVVVDVQGNVMVKGGGLPHKNGYKLAQFHFHWGPDNTKGSEHTYNGQTFPLELHMVSYDTRYKDLTESLNGQDALAVLGFFFEINDSLENCNYSPLLDLIMNVRAKGASLNVPGYKLRHLMPGKFSHYFRYLGSLTTPPCSETVVWTVFLDRIQVTSAQMQKFREMFEDASNKPLLINYRPVQPLHGRKVTTTILDAKTTGGSSQILSLKSLVAILAVLSMRWG